jgi:hypothetical protein
MLIERYGHMDLSDILLSPERIVPFPKAEDREAWENVMPESREQWIMLAEQYADYSWPAIKVEDYARYWKSGNLSKHTNAMFERRSVLGVMVLAECIEGKGRFLDQVVNGIYAVCEETTWVAPLHRLHFKENMEECMPDSSDHIVELVTATTSDLLVWTHYLMKRWLDGVSLRICRRVEREIRDRMLKPYMERSDYWWMGFQEGKRVNNWNPWCNCSALMCFLLLENDSAKRTEAVQKIMRSLDAFINMYPADGCCDEGPTYWGASGGGLYTSLELLAVASGGAIDIFEEPLIRDIGRYIYNVHIDNNFFVAFADGDARVGGGGDLMYRYGKSIGDERLMRLGASRPKGEGPVIYNWFGLYGNLRNLFQEQELLKARGKAPYIRDAWMAATQVMTAREREGSGEGLFLAAKGGHNLESHNHNDVGSFIVFSEGYPLLIDLGTEEYKAQTFGADRFKLWYLQSQYHNLPTVHGILQKEGKLFQAKEAQYEQDDEAAELSLDISEAYPVEAGIVSWRRTFKLTRAADAFIEVTDHFELHERTKEVFYSLMTPCEPVLSSLGTVSLEYAPGRWATLAFDADSLNVRFEKIDFMDQRLIRNWGKRMYRIVLEEKEAVSGGSRTIKIQNKI